MDIFAHMLWTNVVYYKKYKDQLKDRLWAVFFGVAPDLVAFAPATIYAILFGRGGHLMALADSNFWPFAYAREAYNYSHSFMIFLGVFLLVTALRKGKAYWPLLGWALHIAIDLFTHPDFYRTPFLFPISSYHQPYGISWAESKFMLVNYILIAVFYVLIYKVWRRKAKISN